MPKAKPKKRLKRAAPSRSVFNGSAPRKLKELAKLVAGSVMGDGNTVITGISGIKEAGPGDLSFIANSRYLHLLKTTRASAVIASPEVTSAPMPVIHTENPSLAFAKLAGVMNKTAHAHPRGVSPRAVIGKGVRLGRGAAVGPGAVIEDNAAVGDRTVIYAGSYLGRLARVGNDCAVYPNVSILDKVEIGHRVIIHAGTVIGSDGFGFAKVKGVHHKIPQIGTVVIEDDVEIGANVTIDRARFGKTRVGKGTKIDNLVQIAHNVVTGANCILVAQAGISGSTTLGDHVVLAGQAGVVGHISIGDNAMVGAQAGVLKPIPPNAQYWGTPARELRHVKKVNAATQRLPGLYQAVEDLRRRLEALEKRSHKKGPQT